jgi:hypothetical protein
VAAGWSACLGMRSDASRSSTKEEAASPEAAAHVPGQASLSTSNSNRAGQAHTIPLNPQTSSTPRHSTHNAVHPCLQHAQAARHARLPRPAACEEPAPPGHSQDEVACPCMYTNTRLPASYANTVIEGGALWLVAVTRRALHGTAGTNNVLQPTPSPSASAPSRRSPSSCFLSVSSLPSPSAPPPTVSSASSPTTVPCVSTGLAPGGTRCGDARKMLGVCT